jgi:chemotaxis signal transduction protein
MPTPAEAAASTTLLTIRCGASCWALPSFAVAGVERLAEDASTDAPDALELLGLPGSLDDARRVLVVRHADDRARFLVRGTLMLAEATPGNLLPMPSELAGAAPLVSHVAVLDGKPAVFVVSPERLLRAERDQAALSHLSAEGAVRGS